jgi:hypothetical protein
LNMSAKRQSGLCKWGNLLVTRETFEFLKHLGRNVTVRRSARPKRARKGTASDAPPAPPSRPARACMAGDNERRRTASAKNPSEAAAATYCEETAD